MSAPVAAKHPILDTYPGGLKVTDTSRWLEDGSTPETKQWVAGENAHTASLLDALPQRDKILAFLKRQHAESHTTYGSFQVRDGRLFAIRRDPADSASKLVTFDNPEDKASEREILNLGKLIPGTLFQADWYSVSPDGKRVGVALSSGGSEDASLHTFFTANGQPTDEILPHVQFATAGGSMCWKADSSGFFYTRYPRGSERAAEDVNFFQQLFFHTLSTPTSSDTYILGRELSRIAEIRLSTSPDGSHVAVSVEDGDGSEFEFFVVNPDNSVRKISSFADKIASATFGVDNSLWLVSRKHSPPEVSSFTSPPSRVPFAKSRPDGERRVVWFRVLEDLRRGRFRGERCGTGSGVG